MWRNGALLVREDIAMNHKKLRRLYREAGLPVFDDFLRAKT